MSAYDQYPSAEQRPPRPFDPTTGRHYGVWQDGQWMATPEEIVAMQARQKIGIGAPAASTRRQDTARELTQIGQHSIRRTRTDEITLPNGSPVLDVIAALSLSTGKNGLETVIQGLVQGYANAGNDDTEMYYAETSPGPQDGDQPQDTKQIEAPTVVPGAVVRNAAQSGATTRAATGKESFSKARRYLVRPIATVALVGVVAQGAFALSVGVFDRDNSDSSLLTSVDFSHIKRVATNPFLWPLENHGANNDSK